MLLHISSVERLAHAIAYILMVNEFASGSLSSQWTQRLRRPVVWSIRPCTPPESQDRRDAHKVRSLAEAGRCILFGHCTSSVRIKCN